MKLYHGTLKENCESIMQDGLNSGSSFADDPAMAIGWRGLDTVLIEAHIPEEILATLNSARRADPPGCNQWTIPDGMKVLPEYLKILSEEENLKFRQERIQMGLVV